MSKLSVSQDYAGLKIVLYSVFNSEHPSALKLFMYKQESHKGPTANKQKRVYVGTRPTQPTDSTPPVLVVSHEIDFTTHHHPAEPAVWKGPHGEPSLDPRTNQGDHEKPLVLYA